uniref:Uncharacterized protein n=1 Tax=Salarias fasciatus TaxID=181472 RepID=A0A672FJ79_SALFA
MGCGGSRTDALEPRYLESWTKERSPPSPPSTRSGGR